MRGKPIGEKETPWRAHDPAFSVANYCAQLQRQPKTPPHPSVVALTAQILAEESRLTPQQHTIRWQTAELHASQRRDDPDDICGTDDGGACDATVRVQRALRRAMTPRERRFHREAPSRWPGIRFRRFAVILAPSVWYAPFLCRPLRLIMVIDPRPELARQCSGLYADLYARYGYTVLDFSEDFSCPADDSVWDEALAMIGAAIGRKGHA